jgi:hypothetical protein
MYPKQPRGSIRPKVSTLPRQQTEAGQYLDLYKVTIEKKRLTDELASIEQRRQQIQTRLAVLEQLAETLEGKAQQMRSGQVEVPVKQSAKPAKSAKPSEIQPEEETSFETMFLEY